MRELRTPLPFFLLLVFILCFASCSESDPPSVSVGDGGVVAGDGSIADQLTVADPQLPPSGGVAAMQAWLALGLYKNWACEAQAHPPRSPSAHGSNRVCSNALLSGFEGSGEFPTGSAGVKEIYDSNNSISGYAVYRKIKDGTGGDAWYWYETVGSSTFADGVNVGLCVGCHELAGTMGYSGHDFVFTQVQ